MKKIIIVLLILALLSSTGRTVSVRSYECNTMFELKENQKLELFTWINGNYILYITKPMKKDDKAEKYTFQQQIESAILVEHKEMIDEETSKNQ